MSSEQAEALHHTSLLRQLLLRKQGWIVVIVRSGGLHRCWWILAALATAFTPCLASSWPCDLPLQSRNFQNSGFRVALSTVENFMTRSGCSTQASPKRKVPTLLGVAYCGVQKWLRIRFYYLRDIFRNCFTGLGQLGNIYRNSGVSTESKRWQPALRGTSRITGLAPVRIICHKKLQDRALLEIIR